MTRRRGRKNLSTSAIYAYAEACRRRMLDEYLVVQEAEFTTAMTATRGVMISRRGWQVDKTEWEVFFGNPQVLKAYASPELIEYLAAHPRTTRTAFERQWAEMHLGWAA